MLISTVVWMMIKMDDDALGGGELPMWFLNLTLCVPSELP